ncbi:MAG: hypothetical protein AAF598_21760, partial [Bacteroidota bacterium]
MLYRFLLLFVLVGFPMVQLVAQVFKPGDHWVTERCQSLFIKSDSTLVLEQGVFVLARDTACNPFHQVDHRAEFSTYHDLKSEAIQLNYQIRDSILLLSKHPVLSAHHRFEFQIPFQWNKTVLRLDFEQATDLFPHHRMGKCASSWVVKYEQVSALPERTWFTLNFNHQLTLDSVGQYEFHSSGSIKKQGTLLPTQLQHLNQMLAPCPKGKSELYFITPVDGRSTYFYVDFEDGFMIANGNPYYHPMVLKNVHDFLSELTDSLGLSIIRADGEWINTDEKHCLLWYKGEIIQPQDIPSGSIAFSGRIRHQIYVLDKDLEVADQFFDYILLVDEIGPG